MPDQTLAQAIRAKYPGVYDDLSDTQLESQVKAKYPGVYDDLPTTKTEAISVVKSEDATPPSIADNLLTVGKTAASDVYHGLLGIFRTATAPGDAFSNLIQSQVVDPASDQFKKSVQAFKDGRYSEAVGHAAATVLPVVGPMAADVGDLIPQTQTGTPEERSKAAGHILAIVGQAAIPEMAEKGVRAITGADALPAVEAATRARATDTPAPGTGQFTADVMKAAPPSNAAPYSPATINRAAPYLAAEHASAPVTTAAEAVDAGNSARVQIEQKISNVIDAFPHATIDIDPIDAARTALSKTVGAMGAKATDVTAGLKALDGYNLSPDMPLRAAENARNRLNAENDADLAGSDSDVATALRSNPAFAARYAAVQALRDGIYQKLDDLGVPGVQDLRRDEGAVIQMTEAFRRQQYKGSTNAPGTGNSSIPAQIARRALPVIGAAAGEYLAPGVGGVIAGGVIGQGAAKMLAPDNLTRDAAIARAFNNLKAGAPNYPAVPAATHPVALLSGRPIASVVPDTSFVRGVPAQPAPFNSARLIAGIKPRAMSGPDTSFARAVPAATVLNKTRALPPSTFTRVEAPAVTDASKVTAEPAASRVVRDPRTGRFRRIFTSEAQ